MPSIVFRRLPAEDAPGDGELWLRRRLRDPVDPHCDARLMITQGPDAFVRGPGPVQRIVVDPSLHGPSLGQMLAAHLAARVLEGKDISRYERYVLYLERQGARPAFSHDLGPSLANIYLAARLRAGYDLTDPAAANRFLERWGRIAAKLDEAAANGDDLDYTVRTLTDARFAEERSYLLSLWKNLPQYGYSGRGGPAEQPSPRKAAPPPPPALPRMAPPSAERVGSPPRSRQRGLGSLLAGALVGAVALPLVGAAAAISYVAGALRGLTRLGSGPAKSPGEKAVDAVPLILPETVRRHTDVSFPGTVPLGEVVPLRVQIVPAEERLPTGEVRPIERPHEHDRTMELAVPPRRAGEPPPPIRVSLFVTAENFKVLGAPHAEIVVPLEGESAPALFSLRAEAVGRGRVVVDFFQDGRPLGSIKLRPEIAAAGETTTSASAPGQGEIRLRTGRTPPPDVTIIVQAFEHPPGRLGFGLLSRDPRLKDLPVVTGGDVGTIDLKEPLAAWIGRQLDALDPGAHGASAALTARLSDMGNRFYEQLLPRPLQDLCWTFHERGVHSVQILSDDPHIPWELIKPARLHPVTRLWETTPFWGEEFALPRWLRGPATADRFAARRTYALAVGTSEAPAARSRDMVVAPATSPPPQAAPGAAGLAGAAQELATLLTLRSVGAQVRVRPARRDQLLEILVQEFDLLHLICHARFGGENAADDSAVWMEDGPFRAAELPPRMQEKMRRTAPLIFFNACSTGRMGYSLSRVGSWAGEFLRGGCGGFVGSLWPVSDEAAAAFAREFYRHLLEGQPIGEAVRRGRLAVRQAHKDDPTWLAYCCFADPMARMQTAAGGGAARPSSM